MPAFAIESSLTPGQGISRGMAMLDYTGSAFNNGHPSFVSMSPREILKREFSAEERSFLLQARSRYMWDWEAFRRLTSAMYDVAEEVKGRPSIETWIAEGFWYCDTFIRGHTSHPNFPRPPEKAYRDALALLDDLASFLFTGQSPYKDDTLRKKAKDQQNEPS
jgi:hypothetical protein